MTEHEARTGDKTMHGESDFQRELEREELRALASGDRMTANALAAMAELVRGNKEQSE